jgi:Protein of unknown function (DUF3551)
MRMIIFVVAALVLTGARARADGAWCADYFNGAGTNCGFHSYQQCMANISGIGGSCERNPSYQAATESSRRKKRNN